MHVYCVHIFIGHFLFHKYAFNRWRKSFPQFRENLSSSRGKFDYHKSKYKKLMGILYYIFNYIYFYLIVMERSKCFYSNYSSLYLNYKLTQAIFFFQARTFNETPINARKCSHILTKVLYLINQVRITIHLIDKAVFAYIMYMCFFTTRTYYFSKN